MVQSCEHPLIMCHHSVDRPSCVSRFESVGQVIQQANDTEYGLASGVHTRDINKAIKFANELEAGVVWVNQYGALPA